MDLSSDKNGKFVSHNTYLERTDKKWRFVFKFLVSDYIMKILVSEAISI
jgi:hypothetical protein